MHRNAIFIFWRRSSVIVLWHHWTIPNLQLDVVGVLGSFCNYYAFFINIDLVLHSFLLLTNLHSFGVPFLQNHFPHHLTKWTETFATRLSGISLSTNYLQYSEEQFSLRHLGKVQLCLHLVVVALSPVEIRQSLCDKNSLFLFFYLA